jgi:hypothetical protein
MLKALRPLARRALGVERLSTYFLPWITRPGLECVIILNNIEARFKVGGSRGPFPVSAFQYDADGAVARRYEAVLADPTDTAEVRIEPATGGCGFVTVDVSRLQTDLYVTLSDGEAYTVTHGRHEFIEHYPPVARALMAGLGALLRLVGRTIPAFVRHQYVYGGAGQRTDLLLMNLSNVTNRIRISASWNGRPLGARLVSLPPRGCRLVDVSTLTPLTGPTGARRLRLAGNAWFNLYVVGAGPRDAAGLLSLMHVK